MAAATTGLHMVDEPAHVVGRAARVGLDEVGVLGRHLGACRSGSPSARRRRSADRPSRPGGLVNTDPALLPPGWLARRQRTISSMAALPRAGIAGLELVGGRPPPRRWRSRRCAGRRSRGGRPADSATVAASQVDPPVGDQGGRRVGAVAPGVHRAPPPRPSRAPRPPTRDRCSPAAAVRRASTGRLSAARPAPRSPVDGRASSNPVPRDDRQAGETARRPPAGWSRSPPPAPAPRRPGQRPGPPPPARPRRRARRTGRPCPRPGRWCGRPRGWSRRARAPRARSERRPGRRLRVVTVPLTSPDRPAARRAGR